MAELSIHIVTGGPIDVNTYVVSQPERDDCVLIDPGAEISDIESAIGGKRVAAVILTHGHFDHILYAAHFLDQGARLYANEEDVPMLSSSMLNLSGMIGRKIRLPKPDVLLRDGETVEAAGISFLVLHTPGHTKGSVCLLSGKDLFSGDTLFYASYGRTDLPGGDEEEMEKSLRRLFLLDGDISVYPGHGPATRIAWERERRV
ncbi:MAG: MBL fold metallo-hydrolase [Clostridiales bacterium]|nr:MBL fold metallo-hydrolase [Clostridiales bacterium]